LPCVRITEAPSPTDPRGPEQLRARLHDGVPADGHVDVDPRGGGVDHGDPAALVGGNDAAVEFGGEFGKLNPVVDARDERAVVDVLRPHPHVVAPQDFDGVGEVELGLRVVGPQPAQGGTQRVSVERIHAGIDLADRELLWGGVRLLDDADDSAVLRADYAPVSGRVRHPRREHRRGRKCRSVLADQFGQRVCVEHGHVARSDHDRAVEVGGQYRQAAPDGVSSAQLLFLHRDVHGLSDLVDELRDGACELVPVLADHHGEVLWRYVRDGMKDVGEHAATRQRVQHLRDVGAHARACPGGQHDDRDIVSCRHLALPRASRSRSACHCRPRGRKTAGSSCAFAFVAGGSVSRELRASTASVVSERLTCVSVPIWSPGASWRPSPRRSALPHPSPCRRTR
jgi:hypothetical protein